ncbi:MAG TPA: hypothetical protein VKQ30_02345 [Ktedonobacterales bacterium]|nr:hypothetical protein [Ktedonobacterales bacterium]
MIKHKLASLGLVAIAVLVGISSFVSTTQASAVDRSVPTAVVPISPTYQLYNRAGPLVQIASAGEYAAAGGNFFDVRNVPLKLLNVRYFVVTGQLVNGNYTYPYQVKAGKGVQVGGIELAYNLQTHTELIVVGTPTPASGAIVDRLGGHQPTENPSPASVGTGDAPLHLIWRDPVDIWVVEVFDILHWQYDGYQVDGITGINDYEHVVPDGWFGYNKSTFSGYDYSSGHRQDAYDGTAETFANPVFCAAGGGTTYVQVNDNIAARYYDGSRSAQIDTFDFGGCSLLLSSFWKWG